MEIGLTLLAVLMLGSAFAFGYKFGKREGLRCGRAGAVTDLLLVKDPESWDKARF